MFGSALSMPEVVLITGTRKGIGRHLVDHFLQKDCVVAGCSREDFEGSLPQGYRHYRANVADERAVVDMVRDIQQRCGDITVLVNNAGIASMNHLLLTPLSTVERVFSTNVFGTFLVMREVAKLMSAARYGRIVNFATVAT